MPDDEELSAIYAEVNRRGLFKKDADLQAIGHELRRRKLITDPTQGGLVTPAQATQTAQPGSSLSFNAPETFTQQAVKKINETPTLEQKISALPKRTAAPKRGEIDTRPAETVTSRALKSANRPLPKGFKYPTFHRNDSSMRPPTAAEAAQSQLGKVWDAFMWPIQKADEMVGNALLQGGVGSSWGQSKFQEELNRTGRLPDKTGQNAENIFTRLDPMASQALDQDTSVGAGILRFMRDNATPGNALPIASATKLLNAGKALPLVDRAIAGAFGVPMATGGLEGLGQGIVDENPAAITENLMNTFLGALISHGSAAGLPGQVKEMRQTAKNKKSAGRVRLKETAPVRSNTSADSLLMGDITKATPEELAANDRYQKSQQANLNIPEGTYFPNVPTFKGAGGGIRTQPRPKLTAEQLKQSEAQAMAQANQQAQRGRVDSTMPVQPAKTMSAAKPLPVAGGDANAIRAELQRRNAARDAAAKPLQPEPVAPMPEPVPVVKQIPLAGQKQYQIGGELTDKLPIKVQKAANGTKVSARGDYEVTVRPYDEAQGKGWRIQVAEPDAQGRPLVRMIGETKTYAEAVKAAKSHLTDKYTFRQLEPVAPITEDNLSRALDSYRARKQDYAPGSMPISDAAQSVKRIAEQIGKPVPTEVLADYPDLAPKPATPPPSDAQARMQALAQKTVESTPKVEVTPAAEQVKAQAERARRSEMDAQAKQFQQRILDAKTKQEVDRVTAEAETSFRNADDQEYGARSLDRVQAMRSQRYYDLPDEVAPSASEYKRSTPKGDTPERNALEQEAKSLYDKLIDIETQYKELQTQARRLKSEKSKQENLQKREALQAQARPIEQRRKELTDTIRKAGKEDRIDTAPDEATRLLAMVEADPDSSYAFQHMSRMEELVKAEADKYNFTPEDRAGAIRYATSEVGQGKPLAEAMKRQADRQELISQMRGMEHIPQGAKSDFENRIRIGDPAITKDLLEKSNERFKADTEARTRIEAEKKAEAERQAIEKKQVEEAVVSLNEEVKPTPQETESLRTSSSSEKLRPATGLTPTQETFLAGRLKFVVKRLVEMDAENKNLGKIRIEIPGDGAYSVSSIEQANNLHISLTGEPILPHLKTEITKAKEDFPVAGRESANDKANRLEAGKEERARIRQTLAEYADINKKANLGKEENVAPPDWAQRLMQAEATVSDKLQKKLKGKGLQAGVDPEDFALLAELGAIKLARKGMDFATFAKEFTAEVRTKVADDYADSLAPHLRQLYDDAQKINLSKYGGVLTPVTPQKPAEESRLPLRDTETRETPQQGKSATTAPQVTPKSAPSPAVSDMSRMRMRDVEAFAAENGIPLEDKANWKETHRDVIERAVGAYDDILHSIRQYDPKQNALATPEERYVAAMRQREIKGELDKAVAENNTAKVNALLEESKQLSGMMYRAGSEAGRNLQFQQALIGDKLDVNSVLQRAEAMTEGQLSNPARRSLISLASKAEATKAEIDAKVAQRAEAAKQNVRMEQNPAAKEAVSITEQLKGKLTSEDRQKLDKAVARLNEKRKKIGVMADPTGAQTAYNLATMLPDMVEIGALYLKAGVKTFADWSSAMRQHHDKLDEGELQTIWVNAKEALRQERGTPSTLIPQTFGDRLRTKLGSEGAVKFVDAIADTDGNPTILNKMIAGEKLTPQENAQVVQAWEANAPTRRAANPNLPTPDKMLKELLQETAKDRMRIKAARPMDVQKRAAGIIDRANAKLGTLGADRPAKPKPTLPEILIAANEYAKGARSLDAFAKRINAEFGGKVDPAKIDALFSEAVKRYTADYKDLATIKEDMAKVLRQERYRLKTPFGKAAYWAGEVAQGVTSIKATADLSGWLRQGGIMAISRPKVGAKGFRDMLEAAKTEENAKAINEAILNGPNAELYKKAGLDLVSQEEGSPDWQRDEQFVSRMIGQIPGFGRIHNASERAYVTVGNVMRSQLFDALYEPGMSEAEAKDIARYINVVSGRAALSPQTAMAMPTAAKVIWSPRFAISRVQYLLPVVPGNPFTSASTWRTRKIIAQEYGRYIYKVALFAYLAHQAGADVETDWRSTDFLTIRMGRVEIDPTSGLKQYARYAGQLLTGQKKQGEKVVGNDRSATIGQALRGKANPAVGLGYDLLTPNQKGERVNPIGEPYTPGKLATSVLLPLPVENVIEGMMKFGASGETARDLAASTLLDVFGVSTNVRDRDMEARQRALKKRANSGKSSTLKGLGLGKGLGSGLKFP